MSRQTKAGELQLRAGKQDRSQDKVDGAAVDEHSSAFPVFAEASDDENVRDLYYNQDGDHAQ